MNYIENPKPETACRLCGRMNTNRNRYTVYDADDGWECGAWCWGSCVARRRRQAAQRDR